MNMGKLTKEETTELQSTIKTLVNKICSSDEFITQISKTIANTISLKYKDAIDKLEKENVSLKNRVRSLEENINNLAGKHDNLEQKYRNKTLRIYGVKEGRSEKTTKVFIDLAKNKLKLDVKESKIEACYRFGKEKDGKPRPIIISFTRLDIKEQIYASKKALKGSGIVIREDLTQERLGMLKTVLEKVGENGQVWTSNGRIFARYHDVDEIVRINSKKDCEKL